MLQRPEVNPELDLVLERFVDVRPELLWKAWTTPEHLKHWFVPRPWQVTSCELDPRPGGIFSVGMRGPNGEESPASPGCFLEVVENQKLVWTDALGPGYRPKASAFMTATVLFQREGTGTRYIAIVMHKDPQTRNEHEAMGFMQGWGTVLEQLVEFVKNPKSQR
jgi:uncharacterized protein YndB with AHSA1/START domain